MPLGEFIVSLKHLKEELGSREQIIEAIRRFDIGEYFGTMFSTTSTTWMTILIMVLLLIDGYFIFYGKYIKKKLKKAQKWPVTEGIIKVSEVHTTTKSNLKSDLNTFVYFSTIRFTYKVGNREYESGKLNWGGRYQSWNREEITSYQQKYPVGSTVAVHYNPLKPEDSIVEIDVKSSMILYRLGTFVATGVFILFFIGWVILMQEVF